MAQVPGQKAQKIELLRQILWIFLGSTFLSWLSVAIESGGLPMALFTIGCASVAVVSAICFALLRQGMLKSAAWLYLCWIFGLQVGVILNEGVQVAAVISVIACIFIAGFTLSAMAAGWVAAAVAPVVIGGRLLEQHGLTPIEPMQTEFMRSAILITSFIGAGFLAFVAIRMQERSHALRLRAERESIAQLERSRALTAFSRDIGLLNSESTLIRKAVEVAHTQPQQAITMLLQSQGETVEARHWEGESINGLPLDALFRRGVEGRDEGFVHHVFDVAHGDNQGSWEGLSLTISGEGREPFGVLVQVSPSKDFKGVSVAPLLGAVGSIVQGDLVRRWQNEHTQKAQRLLAVGRLAGGVAHDFNNCLAAIVGSVEAIEGRIADNPESTQPTLEDLNRISEASSDASQLVKKLLAFAKGEEEALVALDLADALQAYVDREAHLRLGPAIVDWELPDEEVPVVIGPTSVMRVVDNLLSNALTATPPDGRVRVSLRVVGQTAVLEVEDTGKGMERSVQERALEPFFSSSDSLGHGLGLSIVHGCVSSAGGQVEIQSEVGAGTTITVRFPLGGEDSMQPTESLVFREESAGEESKGLSGVKVVVVDDEQNVRTTICSMLETLGATVVADFPSGVEALSWIKNGGACDVAVTDMTMPGMDGIRLVRELRSIDSELPVVLMTGYARSRRDDLRTLGVTHASKPLRMRDLAACVQEARKSRIGTSEGVAS